jgi:hypothetical protein
VPDLFLEFKNIFAMTNRSVFALGRAVNNLILARWEYPDMRRFPAISFLLSFLPFVLLLLDPAAAAANEKIFVANKCNKCHEISALGITKQKAAAEDEEEEEGAGTKPHDLSDVGKYHDAAFLLAFLKKEVPHTPHEGAPGTKKHGFKFKGSDEELKQLADWLATLKKEPVK